MGGKTSKKAEITTPQKEKKKDKKKSKKNSAINGDTGIEEVGIQEKKDDTDLVQPNDANAEASKKGETDSTGSAPTAIVEDSPDKENQKVAQLSEVQSPSEPSTSPVQDPQPAEIISPAKEVAEPQKPSETKAEPAVAETAAKLEPSIPETCSQSPTKQIPKPADPLPEPVSSPVIESKPEVEQQTVEEKPESVQSPVTEVKPEPVQSPVVEVKPETVQSPVVEVKAEAVQSSVVEVMPEQVVETKSEPVPEPVVEAKLEQVPEPVVETTSAPVQDPVVDAKQEQIPEPVMQAESEPVQEPAVEEKPEPVPEPVVEAQPEPVKEEKSVPESAEPQPEPTAEAQPEPTIVAEPEPVVESQPVPPAEEIKPEPIVEINSVSEAKLDLINEVQSVSVEVTPKADVETVTDKIEPTAQEESAVTDIQSPQATETLSNDKQNEEPATAEVATTPLSPVQNSKPDERLNEQVTEKPSINNHVEQVNGIECALSNGQHEESPTAVTNSQISENGISETPTMISWKHGGQEVVVCGDFCKWEDGCPLSNNDGIFSTKIKLAHGQHHIKFLVDGKWTVDEAFPVVDLDGHGQVNLLVVPVASE